ncbi:MAG TPA: YbdD/YjiX family protein [Gammaproteobacteria bacterium]|nr:YbdD/YjiX family protein [Gammaproteobacteria bacterium]
MTEALRKLWRNLRTATGDDAYERYLAHWRAHHRGEPLDRRAFFREEQRRKWEGVRRCC